MKDNLPLEIALIIILALFSTLPMLCVDSLVCKCVAQLRLGQWFDTYRK